MITNIIKGEDGPGAFRLIRYLLSPKLETAFLAGMQDHFEAGERVAGLDAEHVLGPLPGEQPIDAAKRIADELTAWNSRYRGSKNPPKHPFIHGVISWDPSDDIDSEKAVQITKQVICSAMPGARLTICVCHGDTKHLHVHFVVSTVSVEGTVWNPRFDYDIWMSIMEEQEVLHGFRRVHKRKTEAKDDPSRMPEVRRPTKAERHQKKRTGEPIERELIMQSVDRHSNGFPSLMAFAEALIEDGIEVILNQGSSGKVFGISFRLGDKVISGTRLGEKYKWNAIKERLAGPSNVPVGSVPGLADGNKIGNFQPTDESLPSHFDPLNEAGAAKVRTSLTVINRALRRSVQPPPADHRQGDYR